jgi:hypothetical protein
MNTLFLIILVFLLVVVLAMQFQISRLSKKVDKLSKPAKKRW